MKTDVLTIAALILVVGIVASGLGLPDAFVSKSETPVLQQQEFAVADVSGN